MTVGILVTKDSALILVDVQRDFCPGGALSVPGGDEVVPILNRYVRKCVPAGAHLYATRDWHPAHHMSFKTQGGAWPPHCIHDTPGAAFHPSLALPEQMEIVSKGTRPDEEAYSGFQGTDLERRLRAGGTRRLLIGGLATDYCVKSTVIDGLKLGFEVVLLEDAVRGVEVQPGDSQRAIEEMVKAGAVRARFDEIQVKG